MYNAIHNVCMSSTDRHLVHTLLATRMHGIGFPLGRTTLESRSAFQTFVFSNVCRFVMSNMMTQPEAPRKYVRDMALK